MISKFGEFLYELRKEKGLTQSELADKLGITNKAVSKWETGEAFPETAQLVPLSNIFSITVDELLKGERNHSYTVEEIKEDHEKDKRPELKPMTKTEAIITAASVALILVGALLLVVLILNDVKYNIAVPTMLSCVAAAVFFLIAVSMGRSMRSVEMEQDDFKKGMKSVYMIAGGVMIIILVAAVLVGLVSDQNLGFTLPIFFAILIVGIFILVFGGILWDGFNKKYKLPTDESIKSPKAKNIEDAVCGAIMLTATGIFLFLGFIKNMWHPAWVVFPIGGILCGIASTIIKGIDDTKGK